MIHDFTILDLTPRPGRPSYWDAVLGMNVFCVAYKLLDATGERIRWVKWCDDETGEVVRYDRRPDGLFNVDPQTKRIVLIRGRHPAPLRVVELEPGEVY